MRSSMGDTNSGAAADVRWRAIFEDRYGPDGFERLRKMFGQPCVTFAAIAEQFGVTRERVRQWHLRLLPDAPRGHERQRLCLLSRRKRRLFEDALFRSFYVNVRRHVEPGHLGLVRSPSGFLKHVVHIHGKVVLIREAGQASRRRLQAAYAMRVGHTPCDFIYYRISEQDFLFVPRKALPRAGTHFIDNGRSKYLPFKNSFSAVLASNGLRQDGPTAEAPEEAEADPDRREPEQGRESLR